MFVEKSLRGHRQGCLLRTLKRTSPNRGRGVFRKSDCTSHRRLQRRLGQVRGLRYPDGKRMLTLCHTRLR